MTIKTGLTAIALLLCVNLSAQEKPVTFGVKGGLNLSNMTQDLKGDAKVGFNLGVTMHYALQNNFYLLTGLSYSLEGTKEDEIKLNLSYLKLPIHFGYKLPVDNNTKIVFHAGPYLAYALDGKYKSGGVSIDAFDDDVQEGLGFKLKRFDMGLGLGIDAEFGQLCVGLNCDLGLTNLIDVKDRNEVEDIFGTASPKGKNTNASLTIRYKF